MDCRDCVIRNGEVIGYCDRHAFVPCPACDSFLTDTVTGRRTYPLRHQDYGHAQGCPRNALKPELELDIRAIATAKPMDGNAGKLQRLAIKMLAREHQMEALSDAEL